MSFWNKLEKPIFALAPMEEVTDFAFREMFARYGKPSVMFTEFVSVDGLMHEEGRKRLSIDLKFSEIQRPMVAQIWGRDPEKFAAVAEYLVSLGFDGIDINFGCPQSKEIAAGTCAALIREPKLAQEIIRATQKAAGDLPVSVKTRLGYSKTDELETWLKYLLEMNLANITLHGRTKQEMSKVPAHWNKIAQAVQIRNRENPATLILGNGDVKSREDGLHKIKETGADGVMIARGAFGNPWIFNALGGENPLTSFEGSSPSNPLRSSPFQGFDGREVSSPPVNAFDVKPSVKERFRVMLEHAELFEKTFFGIKSFAIMRKHFKAYCSGFPGAAELRAKLMETHNVEETRKIVEDYFKGNKN